MSHRTAASGPLYRGGGAATGPVLGGDNGAHELTWHTAREIFGGVVTERKPDPGPSVLGYRVGVENTPLAGRVRMLRIEPSVAFAREFGLLTTQPAGTAKADKR